MDAKAVVTGLRMAIAGLDAVCAAIEQDAEREAPKAEQAAPKAEQEAPKAERKPEKAEPRVDARPRGEVERMKYNDFKKFAAKAGVDCKGTRQDIMARLEAAGAISDPAPKAPEDDVMAAPPKSAAPKAPGKSAPDAGADSKGAPEALGREPDEFDRQAEEVIASTPIEDVLAALKDVEVRANKLNAKRKLAEALREGLIAIDDEGGLGIDEDAYTQEYDLCGANAPEEMTDERREACTERQRRAIAAINDGSLTTEGVVDFLQNNATQEELDLLGDDYEDSDLVRLYLEVAKHFIDDEGEEHEPADAYLVGDVPFCCGQPLEYNEERGTYLCSHCAGEYDAE